MLERRRVNQCSLLSSQKGSRKPTLSQDFTFWYFPRQFWMRWEDGESMECSQVPMHCCKLLYRWAISSELTYSNYLLMAAFILDILSLRIPIILGKENLQACLSNRQRCSCTVIFASKMDYSQAKQQRQVGASPFLYYYSPITSLVLTVPLMMDSIYLKRGLLERRCFEIVLDLRVITILLCFLLVSPLPISNSLTSTILSATLVVLAESMDSHSAFLCLEIVASVSSSSLWSVSGSLMLQVWQMRWMYSITY